MRLRRLRYSQLSLYFEHVCVAKPKSSRNSSVEAFVVCRTFTPPPGCGSPGSGLSLCAPADASSAAHALAAEHVLLDHSYGAAHANEEAGAPARSLIVPFVACGDLAGFDSDASYPLELAAARAARRDRRRRGGAAATGADDGAEAAADARRGRAPVQPPSGPDALFERQKTGRDRAGASLCLAQARRGRSASEAAESRRQIRRRRGLAVCDFPGLLERFGLVLKT